MGRKKRKRTGAERLAGIDWRMRVLTSRIARHQTAVVRRSQGLSYTPADIMPGGQFDTMRKELVALRSEYRKLKTA